KKYVIEYRRVPPLDQSFDPYLRIESLDGQRLVEHDDILLGNDMDSRIEFTPTQKATYRICCSLFQFPLPPGQWPFTLTIREHAVPQPAAVPALSNVAVPKPGVTNQAL